MNAPAKTTKPAPTLNIAEAVKAEMERRRAAAGQDKQPAPAWSEVAGKPRRKFGASR